jgi:hypothetical protein
MRQQQRQQQQRQQQLVVRAVAVGEGHQPVFIFYLILIL